MHENIICKYFSALPLSLALPLPPVTAPTFRINNNPTSKAIKFSPRGYGGGTRSASDCWRRSGSCGGGGGIGEERNALPLGTVLIKTRIERDSNRLKLYMYVHSCVPEIRKIEWYATRGQTNFLVILVGNDYSNSGKRAREGNIFVMAR